MMIQCQHCGSQVRVTKSATGGLLAPIMMVLVVAIGGMIVYRSLYVATSKDTAAIGSHIGQIGE